MRIKSGLIAEANEFMRSAIIKPATAARTVIKRRSALSSNIPPPIIAYSIIKEFAADGKLNATNKTKLWKYIFSFSAN
jgi:hypothetical protein